MACQVLLEFRAKEDCIEKMRDWFRKILPDTRGFSGCVSIQLVQNQEDPQNMVILEQWDSRQHYEKYLGWRTENGDLEVLVAMMDGEPNIRYYDFFGV
jgi:quinol monooxygenase YgiN